MSSSIYRSRKLDHTPNFRLSFQPLVVLYFLKIVRLLFAVCKIVATCYPCLANSPRKIKLDLDIQCRDPPETFATAGGEVLELE